MMPILTQQKARRPMPKTFLSQCIVIVGMSLGLCACNSVDRTETSSIPMDDYRVRHPIVLAETARTIDIFPVGGGASLDQQSAARVMEFAQLYTQLGEGPILILYPVGPHHQGHGAIEAIRRMLVAGGAHTGVRTGSYPVTDAQLASPIRLSFTGLKAKVATPCGEWPSDLASGSTVQGWDNKPYWNFGCAYQSAFAAQVADPRDLTGPQAETTMDTVMRARDISSIRDGKDPSTNWQTKTSAISTVGAN